MSYVLVIMLFWSSGSAVESIPVQNEKLCEAARVEVLEVHDSMRSSKQVKAFCMKVREGSTP